MRNKRQPDRTPAGPIEPSRQLAYLQRSVEKHQDAIVQAIRQRETTILTLKVTVERGVVRQVERYASTRDEYPRFTDGDVQRDA